MENYSKKYLKYFPMYLNAFALKICFNVFDGYFDPMSNGLGTATILGTHLYDGPATTDSAVCTASQVIILT